MSVFAGECQQFDLRFRHSLRAGRRSNDNNSLPFERRGVTVEQKLGGPHSAGIAADRFPRPASQRLGYFFDGKKPTIVTLNYSDCPMLCNVSSSPTWSSSLDKMELQIGQDFQSVDRQHRPDGKRPLES